MHLQDRPVRAEAVEAHDERAQDRAGNSCYTPSPGLKTGAEDVEESSPCR